MNKEIRDRIKEITIKLSESPKYSYGWLLEVSFNNGEYIIDITPKDKKIIEKGHWAQKADKDSVKSMINKAVEYLIYSVYGNQLPESAIKFDDFLVQFQKDAIDNKGLED